MRFEKLQKNKKSLYKLTLMKEFIIKKIEIDKINNIFYFFERNVFSFLTLFNRTFQFL